MSFSSPVLKDPKSASKLQSAKQVSRPTHLTLADSGGSPASRGRGGWRLKSPFHSASTSTAFAVDPLTVDDVAQYGELWFLEGRGRHTAATMAEKQDKFARFVWFLRERGYTHCDAEEIDAFIEHVKVGHLEPGGRWGNPSNNAPVRPITVRDYYSVVAAFFNHLVRKGIIPFSPAAIVLKPTAQKSTVRIYTSDEVKGFLAACERAWHPARESAIVWTLYDTGIRATELCRLQMRHFNAKNQSITVHGKGDKTRVVGPGKEAFTALSRYVREQKRKPDSPLFLNDRGVNAGGHLTRFGLGHILQRLADTAGIENGGIHIWRHTFATRYIQANGDSAGLQAILGHTTPTMTAEYIHLAGVDACEMNRRFSPGDRLFRPGPGL